MLKRFMTAFLALCLLVICFIPGTAAYAEAAEKKATKEQPKIEKVSDTEMRMFVQRDEETIFCKVHLPEGKEKCPALIMASGLHASFTTCEDFARAMAKSGIVGIVFDFCGAVFPSKSTGDMTDMSIETEIADLLAVLDAVSTLPRVDPDNIFIGGHSFGGLVAALTATRRPDDIKGLLLVEPSFQLPDQVRTLLPEGTEIPDKMVEPIFCGGDFLRTMIDLDPYETLPDYPGKTVIYAGGVSPSIGADEPQLLERAAETFPDAELISFPKADHGFRGSVRADLIKQMKTFILENAEEK